jgi:uroporphyrinogen-III synthase
MVAQAVTAMKEPTAPLAGRGIVVTRPAQQAQTLAALIRAAGGRALLFPVIEIADVADAQPLRAVLDRLDRFDLAIFVSPNAVDTGMKLIATKPLPPRLKIAAIGGGSAKALARFGVQEVIAPARRFDSEALLELPALAQVGGQRIVIFRGEGGRDVLGATLAQRGALVEYAECYRRQRPQADVASLLQAWERGEAEAVVVTSSEGVRNLFDMMGKAGRSWLQGMPLFAPHPRIAETARGLGAREALVTPPRDEGILAGLVDYFRALPRP